MMVDFALDAQRNGNISAREAIFQASLLRFRPIIMTTLAALFGALPWCLAVVMVQSYASRWGLPSSVGWS